MSIISQTNLPVLHFYRLCGFRPCKDSTLLRNIAKCGSLAFLQVFHDLIFDQKSIDSLVGNLCQKSRSDMLMWILRYFDIPKNFLPSVLVLIVKKGHFKLDKKLLQRYPTLYTKYVKSMITYHAVSSEDLPTFQWFYNQGLISDEQIDLGFYIRTSQTPHILDWYHNAKKNK